MVTGLLVGIAVLLWAALFWELVAAVPLFERRFREFRLKLPWVTEALINTSRWFVLYWYVLVLLILPALAVAAVISHLLRQPAVPRWLGAVWFLLLGRFVQRLHRQRLFRPGRPKYGYCGCG